MKRIVSLISAAILTLAMVLPVGASSSGTPAACDRYSPDYNPAYVGSIALHRGDGVGTSKQTACIIGSLNGTGSDPNHATGTGVSDWQDIKNDAEYIVIDLIDPDYTNYGPCIVTLRLYDGPNMTLDVWTSTVTATLTGGSGHTMGWYDISDQRDNENESSRIAIDC